MWGMLLGIIFGYHYNSGNNFNASFSGHPDASWLKDLFFTDAGTERPATCGKLEPEMEYYDNKSYVSTYHP
jgi:hypothetical protein